VKREWTYGSAVFLNYFAIDQRDKTFVDPRLVQVRHFNEIKH